MEYLKDLSQIGERVFQLGDQLCPEGGGRPQVPNTHQTGLPWNLSLKDSFAMTGDYESHE